MIQWTPRSWHSSFTPTYKKPTGLSSFLMTSLLFCLLAVRLHSAFLRLRESESRKNRNVEDQFHESSQQRTAEPFEKSAYWQSRLFNPFRRRDSSCRPLAREVPRSP